MSYYHADKPTIQTRMLVMESEPGTIKRVSSFGVGREKKKKKRREERKRRAKSKPVLTISYERNL